MYAACGSIDSIFWIAGFTRSGELEGRKVLLFTLTGTKKNEDGIVRPRSGGLHGVARRFCFCVSGHLGPGKRRALVHRS